MKGRDSRGGVRESAPGRGPASPPGASPGWPNGGADAAASAPAANMGQPKPGPDLAQLWFASPERPVDAAAALDRATRRRRLLSRGPEWAKARLEEGLARLLIARDVADWGHRSYAIQAVEAAMDALRDAAAHLPPSHEPSPEQVAALREAVVERWAAIAHDPLLHGLAELWPGSLVTTPKDTPDDPQETV